MGQYRGKRHKVRKLWVLAALLWTGFIWYNSLQTAVVSSSHSWWVVELLRPILERTSLPEDWWEVLVRKAAHMTEFGVLALCWSAALQIPRRRDVCRAALLTFVLTAATAACDETIQLFVPGRAGMLTDVLIDSTGAVLAMALYLCVMLISRRIRD